ncbi:ankyrin repeat domain-containing protein [Pseudoalteromonas sp. T1lg122]|uniref:ankyrin repeat domain-containing protein n=1 Tax=Pseudoalteromonas sp. T1lg122 TaxID=2077094 RepID=UPI000CF62888|nr:ankyrin repeat domain-containing protein [Pseudoalteromonas sp. T1lg122]
MITDQIGKNIKSLREGRKMSQKDLANKINVARPVISNWENGKNEPSSSQLIKLAQTFERSTDEILGIATDSQRLVVVDTSALIKRPNFLSDLLTTFDEVIVPDIVISELNNLKDRGKPAVKQKAWLVMSSVNNIKDRLTISKNHKNDGNNDEKIADVAIRRARAKPNNEVYLLSDDIYFQFLCKGVKNLSSITPQTYAQQFANIDTEFDPVKTIEFVSLIKSCKLEDIKTYDLEGVDVNFHNPDDGFTPLITAVRSRNQEILKYILSLPNIDVDKQDKHKYNFSPVHHATQLKNLSMIKVLAEHGADIDLGSGAKNAGNTPLMISAWSGFNLGVDFFLDNGACVNQQDSNGYTALFKACIKNYEKIISKLVPLTDLAIRCRKNKQAADYLNPKKINHQTVTLLFKDRK